MRNEELFCQESMSLEVLAALVPLANEELLRGGRSAVMVACGGEAATYGKAKSRYIVIPEYRDTGIPEYRDTRIPEYRNIVIPEYRKTGIPENRKTVTPENRDTGKP